MYVYTYIYIEREREIYRDICVYTYIYIYIMLKTSRHISYQAPLANAAAGRRAATSPGRATYLYYYCY